MLEELRFYRVCFADTWASYVKHTINQITWQFLQPCHVDTVEQNRARLWFVKLYEDPVEL